MKKRVVSAACMAMGILMAASLTACGSSSSTATTAATTAASDADSTVNKEVTEDEYNSFYLGTADVYKQYVTLGDYEGISVTVDRSSEAISDDDVDSKVSTLLSNSASTQDVTDGGVTQSGDVITLDYSGLLDGVAFTGGTATDASYTIGSGKFISDLDTGLVGLSANTTYDIPCTFPSDYSSSDLAGKSVVFEVTISKISRSIVPTLSDDWVASNSSTLGYGDVTTVDGLKEAIRASLKKTAVTSDDETKFNDVIQTVISNSTINGAPQAESDNLLQTVENNVQSEFNTYGSYYGISDYDTYLSTVYGFSSEDDFVAYAKEYVQSYLEQKMVIILIAQKEGITVTAQDIEDTGNELATQYGYTDYQTILDQYGNELNAEVGYQVLFTKVEDLLNSSAVEN